MPSSGLHRQQACVQYTEKHAYRQTFTLSCYHITVHHQRKSGHVHFFCEPMLGDCVSFLMVSVSPLAPIILPLSCRIYQALPDVWLWVSAPTSISCWWSLWQWLCYEYNIISFGIRNLFFFFEFFSFNDSPACFYPRLLDYPAFDFRPSGQYQEWGSSPGMGLKLDYSLVGHSPVSTPPLP